MTEAHPKDLASIIVGLAAFVVAAMAGFTVWGILGALTGVLAPCATAPDWWIGIFLFLGLAIFVGSVCVSAYVAKKV